VTTHSPEPRIAVPEQLHPDGMRGFDPAAEVVDFSGETMGTVWRVRAALVSGIGRDRVRAAIQDKLDEIVRQMSHWDDTSLLSVFNCAAPGHWSDLPLEFAAVIASALAIAEQTSGAFDPAIGRLTDLWGLGPNRRPDAPSAAKLRKALEQSGWHRLAYDPETRRLRQPGGLWLDLSGIAKGYAADAVADCLADLDIFHALTEIGGECVGRGIRPDGDPWWVEAEAPFNFTGPPIRVALHQLAVATSGDYLKGAHTIDPATGELAIHSTSAVTVVHPSCMVADARASALLVLPPETAQILAAREGICARLISRTGDEWLSPALAAML
jgi:thiamine biosynthesis lipoprotein